jgi:hypothetical protein
MTEWGLSVGCRRETAAAAGGALAGSAFVALAAAAAEEVWVNLMLRLSWQQYRPGAAAAGSADAPCVRGVTLLLRLGLVVIIVKRAV